MLRARSLLFLALPSLLVAQRPNVVLIFPDNLGWGEVGAYGSVRGVPTPNIDSLAKEVAAATVTLQQTKPKTH